MGEIIVSILIGAFLVVSGIAMNIILGREEKQWKAEESGRLSGKSEPRSGGNR